MIHYFAYGSNMSGPRLRARLSGIRFVAIGQLRRHRLLFHKRSVDGSAKCDAFHTGDPSDIVHGVLWAIPTEAQASLDRFEGCGNGYEAFTVGIETVTDSRIEARTYRASDLAPNRKPYGWYWSHVLLGAREHGLPAAYLRTLEETAWVSDPDDRRRVREMAIYPTAARDPLALLRCNPDTDLPS